MFDHGADVAGAVMGHVARDLADLVVGQTEGLGHFAQGRPRLERVEGADHGHVVGAVLAVHVVDDLVPAAPADIEVDIGAIGAREIEEALEVEVVFEGVHARDAEGVGHQAVGGRAPAHDRHVVRARVAHDVPHDEEVRREPELVDDVELVLEPLNHRRRQRLVAFPQPVEGPLP